MYHISCFLSDPLHLTTFIQDAMTEHNRSSKHDYSNFIIRILFKDCYVFILSHFIILYQPYDFTAFVLIFAFNLQIA